MIDFGCHFLIVPGDIVRPEGAQIPVWNESYRHSGKMKRHRRVLARVDEWLFGIVVAVDGDIPNKEGIKDTRDVLVFFNGNIIGWVYPGSLVKVNKE